MVLDLLELARICNIVVAFDSMKCCVRWSLREVYRMVDQTAAKANQHLIKNGRLKKCIA